MDEVVAGTEPGFDQLTVGIVATPQGEIRVSAHNEIQTIRLTSAGAEDLHGSVRIAFGSDTTAAIAWDATAEDIRNEIHAALGGVSAVNVAVTARAQSMSGLPRIMYGRDWTVEFAASRDAGVD